MYAAPTFYDQVGAGTRVIVLNSPEAPAPPDEGKAVPNAVAPSDTTPSTTPTTTPPAPAPAPADSTTTTTPPAPTTTTTTTVASTTNTSTVATLPAAAP